MLVGRPYREMGMTIFILMNVIGNVMFCTYKYKNKRKLSFSNNLTSSFEQEKLTEIVQHI